MNEPIIVPLNGQAVIRLDALDIFDLPLAQWPVEMTQGPIHYRTDNAAIAVLDRQTDDGTHEAIVLPVSAGECNIIAEAQFAPPGRPPGPAATIASRTIQVTEQAPFKAMAWTLVRIEPKP